MNHNIAKKIYSAALTGILGFTAAGLISGSNEAWAKKKETEKKAVEKKVDEEKAIDKTTVTAATPSEEGEESAGGLNLPVIPKVSGMVPNVPQIPKVPRVGVNFPQVQPVLPSPGEPNIKKIQKQINDIIKLNENLKVRYQSQASEIQRITDQAKIHRQILENMSNLKGRKILVKPMDRDEVLRQEKVRLIQKTTEENRKYVETLGQKGKEESGGSASGASSAKVS